MKPLSSKQSGICVATGKVKHRSRAEAAAIMQKISVSRRRGGKPSVYRCQFCGAWHWGHFVKLRTD